MNHKTRRSPRFPFIAVAEIADTESEGDFSCRVSELSLNGCYVDMLNALPIGSEVRMKIFSESECFEANVSRLMPRSYMLIPTSGWDLHLSKYR